jgi:hypothetical protein
MFTSATLAAARLSALESYDCFKRSESSPAEHHEQADVECVHGNTPVKNRPGKKNLGSSLVSVAALISKLDEEQPTQWESRSSPTLQLRPIRKPDEALRIFLKKVESHRLNRLDSEADTRPVQEGCDGIESQTVTLDRVPAYDREVRRTAYSLLMRNCGPHRDFVTASDNRFNASTSILTARAEALLLAERLLRRVENGFTVTTAAWTLTAPVSENTPALFESCRTPASIKVSVQDCRSMMQQPCTSRPGAGQFNAMAAATSVA